MGGQGQQLGVVERQRGGDPAVDGQPVVGRAGQVDHTGIGRTPVDGVALRPDRGVAGGEQAEPAQRSERLAQRCER